MKKIIINIRKCLKKIIYMVFKQYLKFKYPHVTMPLQITFNGLPFLMFCKKSRVILNESIIFTSDPKVNYVGLSKRCSVYVAPGASLYIGSNSGFSGVSIYCSKDIYIGNNVNVGGNCWIWDTDFHQLNLKDRATHDRSKIKSKNVYIGDDVFIGANSMILKGIRIGDRSIIGAGSVVTKDVPSDEIWAGNPARFIRNITAAKDVTDYEES